VLVGGTDFAGVFVWRLEVALQGRERVMQKEAAIALADRIMREAPEVSVRVEHEGAYAPDSYAVQVQQGIVPDVVTITSDREWEEFRAGLETGERDWDTIQGQMDRTYRPEDGKERPTQ
jgi:hypothetical protein